MLAGLTSQHESMHSKLKSSCILKVRKADLLHGSSVGVEQLDLFWSLFPRLGASGPSTGSQRWWPHVFLPAWQMVLSGDSEVIARTCYHPDVRDFCALQCFVCVSVGSHSGLVGKEGSCCPLPEHPHLHPAWCPWELPQGMNFLTFEFKSVVDWWPKIHSPRGLWQLCAVYAVSNKDTLAVWRSRMEEGSA